MLPKWSKCLPKCGEFWRDDGTLWLNIGDSYCSDDKWGGSSGGKNYTSKAGGFPRQRRGSDFDPKRGPAAPGQPMGISGPGVKPKDLIGIPWMLAFALRADGWWLRQDIIWSKGNCMPESVTDRCTKSHEYLFLLTKSERYFYDSDAIAEDSVSDHASGNGFDGRQGGAAHMPMSGGAGSTKQWTPTRPSVARGGFNGKNGGDGRRRTKCLPRRQRETQPPISLDDQYQALPRRSLRHVPAGPDRAVYQGGKPSRRRSAGPLQRQRNDGRSRAEMGTQIYRL